jgi:hypothetical protein
MLLIAGIGVRGRGQLIGLRIPSSVDESKQWGGTITHATIFSFSVLTIYIHLPYQMHIYRAHGNNTTLMTVMKTNRGENRIQRQWQCFHAKMHNGRSSNLLRIETLMPNK